MDKVPFVYGTPDEVTGSLKIVKAFFRHVVMNFQVPPAAFAEKVIPYFKEW
ncbi:MAG: hypothetical protein QXM52_06715 [Candidatus Bathyarchaeia archaeon]